MDKELAVRVKELGDKIKPALTELIEANATEASQIAVKSVDPHTPIIVFMQVSMANACAEYLMRCGIPLPVAVDATSNHMSAAMQSWIKQLIKDHTPEPKAM